MTRHITGIVLLLSALCAPAAAQPVQSELVDAWRAGGKTFAWTSTLPDNAARSVAVFYRCEGDPAKPSILMVHGFPTSSFDFRLPAHDLAADYHVCTLDFPGYGLSDKPLGYRYTLADDAAVLWRFVTEIVPLREFAVLAHDRGDSVALSFLQRYTAATTRPFRITHLFLTNGNLYLPLANLTPFQTRMLDPATSAAAVKAMTPTLLATGLGQTQYTPPLAATDPEVRALAALFAHQSGIQAIPATIQYLNERRQMETVFLETLARSDVPASILWGVHDTVAPLRVARHVFEVALKPRPVPGMFWVMPCGNHYLPHDQPADLARAVRFTLAQQAAGALPGVPHNLGSAACAPVLVGREQPR